MYLDDRVIYITKPGKINYACKKLSISLKDEEALIRVCRVTLCGSDYKIFSGDYGGIVKYPMIFGHEWAGQVVAIGKNVSNVKVGDKVTGDCSIWCGHCTNCSIDKNLCKNIGKYGITQDGFAQEYKIVASKYLYAGAKNLPYEVLALTECFAVVLHAIKRIQRKINNSNILIVGGGALGISAYMILHYMFGCNNVHIYETIKEKRDFLNKLFHEMRIIEDFTDEKDSKQYGNYCELYGDKHYDIVIEAAGTQNASDIAMSQVKAGGTVLLLGLGQKTSFNHSIVVLKALDIYGNVGGTGEFKMVLKFFEKFSDLPISLVTSTYNFMDSYKAFNDPQRLLNIKTQIAF